MADFPEDIFFGSITEIGDRLLKMEFSAADLTRAFADRLERLGPRYNALALSLREQAVKRAKDVDDDLKRDRLRGPLQGIPFGAKDLLAYPGNPTTWGAKPFAGQVINETATVISKLQKTGAPLIGKLSMVELAGGPTYRYAAASLQGPGLNPWDRTRWSGGSSSGSGAAVAAGLVPFALGSETSGSILTPSAFCGVTGLRPTYGLVSRFGAMPLSWTLDTIGPIARSAEDCGLVLAVIAGGDSKDPGSAGKSFYFAPRFARALKDTVVGFAPADFVDWPDPSTRPALQQAFNDIKALGVQMKEVTMPDFPYSALVSTVISAEAASIFEDLITSGRVDQLADQKQIARLKASLDIPAREYLRAMRIRSLLVRSLRDLMTTVDVLLAPTRMTIAPKISEPLDKPPDRPQPATRGLTGLIPAGNLAGLPALSLPCGFSEGMPVAIQLVGRAWTENMLLNIGREYQSRTDWHRRRPPA